MADPELASAPVSQRVAGAARAGARRVRDDAWLILQGAAAATAAWVIAKYVLGHPEPFFAPVAAVIGLNATLGERGLHTVRLLYGVILGILVGELVLLTIGDGYGSLGLATFVAIAIAHGLGGARITVAQAAVGAILTIALAQPEAGLDRLVDALVGTGVALVFSQVLFSPEPVGLLRRVESAALRDMADGMELAARSLESGNEEFSTRALDQLRAMRDRLAELGRVRTASARVARRSLPWRSRRGPVVRERENAGQLDLLAGSCLMLTRVAIEATPDEQRHLAPCVRELSRGLAEMASDPGDRETRQEAADGALAVARELSDSSPAPDSALAAAVIATRIAVTDLMTFAGVEPGDAIEAVRRTTGGVDVAPPPPIPRSPISRGG